MAKLNKNTEAKQPKKTVTKSVEDLINKKKSEKESGASESAAAKMQDTKEDVDVIVGMEKPSEKISERAGEKGEGKGSSGAQAKQSDDDQTAQVQIKQYDFPSDAVMIKKIRTAINTQIKEEWKKAAKYQGKLSNGSAAKYTKAIAKIRALKQILSTLFTSAAGFLKEMYTKYFMPNGKRRRVEDVT